MLFLAACGGGEPANSVPGWQQAIDQADAQMAEGDPAGAIATLEDAEQEFPAHPELIEALAFAYLETEDWALAAVFFEALIQQQPERPDLLLYAARALEAQDQSPQAAAKYQAYLEQRPDDAISRKQLVNLYLADGQLAEAWQQWRQVQQTQHPPPSYQEMLDFAKLGLRVRRHAEAAEAFQSLLNRHDLSPELRKAAHLGLLEARLRLRDWEAAWEAMQALDADFPNHLDQSNLAHVRSELDAWRMDHPLPEPITEVAPETPVATEPPEPVPPVEPETPVAEAEPVTEVAVNNGPDSIVVNDQPYAGNRPSGSIYINDQPYAPPAEEAEPLAEETTPAPAETPAEPSPEPDFSAREFAQQGLLAYQQERFAEAAQAYAAALGQDATQPAYAFGASRAYFALGQMEDAEITAEESVRLEAALAEAEQRPAEAHYTHHYLRVIQKSRPSHRLLVELIKAQQAFPGDPLITLGLARAYDLIQRDSRQATRLYERFLQLAPNHPEAANVRARLAP